MVIDIKTKGLFNSPFFTTTNYNYNDEIERIILDGNDVDFSNVEDLLICKDCIIKNSEITKEFDMINMILSPSMIEDMQTYFNDIIRGIDKLIAAANGESNKQDETIPNLVNEFIETHYNEISDWTIKYDLDDFTNQLLTKYSRWLIDSK